MLRCCRKRPDCCQPRCKAQISLPQGSAEAVAKFYARDGWIVIDRGEPREGWTRVAEMAAGFFADVPDLKLVCDGLRCAGNHVVYLWTFTGTHSGTKTRCALPDGRNGTLTRIARSRRHAVGTTRTSTSDRRRRDKGSVTQRDCNGCRSQSGHDTDKVSRRLIAQSRHAAAYRSYRRDDQTEQNNQLPDGAFQIPRSCISRTCRSITSRL
jgi:hypothetical protein